MLPKTEESIGKDYVDCQRRKKFVVINKDSYIDYVNESRRDLASAQTEFDSGNLKWALVKIYQSLFLLCNALLVKHCGFYSKDHKCILVALIRHNVIFAEDLSEISKSLHKKDLFEEISSVRIDRNQAMYFPGALRKINNDAIGQDFIRAKTIILKLFEGI